MCLSVTIEVPRRHSAQPHKAHTFSIVRKWFQELESGDVKDDIPARHTQEEDSRKTSMNGIVD